MLLHWRRDAEIVLDTPGVVTADIVLQNNRFAAVPFLLYLHRSPCFSASVQLVHVVGVDNDDRAGALAVGGGIEIVDVDIRVLDSLQQSVQAARLVRDLKRPDGGALDLVADLRQQRAGLVREGLFNQTALLFG